MSDIVRIDARAGRRPLHDIAATRTIEAARLAASVPFALMEAAGAAVGRLAIALAPHARECVVFAGPGNNGGDGVVAATFLHRLGRSVSVVSLADPARLPADAGEAMARARAAGVPFIPADELELPGRAVPELVIDALLGIGSTRVPAGALAAAIERMHAWARAGACILAVDVPSGFDADRGQPFGLACVRADHTLTMLTLKPGLFTAHGGDLAGHIWLAGLDTAASPPGAVGDAVGWLVGAGDPALRAPSRRPSQHKGSFGDVAVIGGAPGMRGAAWLAARAAHAAGCGRVFVELLGGEPACLEGDAQRPELMLRPGWSAGDPAAVASAVTVCGCGGGDLARQPLPRLLSICKRLVLDADALNAVARDEALQDLLAGRRRRGLATILTPHPLEAARLMGLDAAAVQADRLGRARALAERFACVVVLKGAGTVIAAPGELVRINASGNASLASAGTGDVLAGWIGGRWAIASADASAAATGTDPASASDGAFEVATRSVIEHGLAAGPERPGALRAADLVEALHRLDRGEHVVDAAPSPGGGRASR